MSELSLEQQTQRDIQRDLPWNFTVSMLDTAFIMLGLSMVSRETVMPALVQHLTDSKFALGLIPAIYQLGMNLPQLLMANFSERLRYKLPFVLWVAGPGERGAYLLIALVIWGLAAEAPKLALVLFFVLLAITATAIGVATPAWFDMIAKVIPVARRGTFSGVSHGLGALLGVAGAALVGWLLTHYPFPNNFALLFGAAFLSMLVSYGWLALTREPPSLQLKAYVPLRDYFRQLPAILRRDRNYLRFLVSRFMIYLGAMASGFYIAYANERFGIGGAGVGFFTAILVGSGAVMSLVWGLVSDRLGHKTVLATAAFALGLAALSAWLATSQVWLVVTYGLLGAFIAGETTSSLNICLEFSTPADRPTYIGLTNTLMAPVLALAPLLGGWLATIMGYRGLFAVAAITALLGALLLTLWVREPRTRTR